MFKSNTNPIFRTKLAEDIFNYKYRHTGAETWEQLADTLVEHVVQDKAPKDVKQQIGW